MAVAARAVSARPRRGARLTRSASAAPCASARSAAMMAVVDHVAVVLRADSAMTSPATSSPVAGVSITSTSMSPVIVTVDVAMGAEPGDSVITRR